MVLSRLYNALLVSTQTQRKKDKQCSREILTVLEMTKKKQGRL